MSGGRLKVKLYAAGEIVPAFEVMDAVGGGTAEIGHTASIFWMGKAKVAGVFTAVPFGLMPLEHIAWIEHGGGQALWDELYAGLGVKPFMAGNTGMSMEGWFKRELHGVEDLKGLKFRMPGPRRRDVCPARHRPGLDTAGRDPAGAAERGHRRHRVRRALQRPLARLLQGRTFLLRPRHPRAQRHRRVHRRPARPGTRCRPTSKPSSRTPAAPRTLLRLPRASG